MSKLVRKRGYKRTAVTKVCDEIHNLDLGESTLQRKREFIDKLQKLRHELDILNDQITDEEFDDTVPDSVLNETLRICEEYDDKIMIALGVLKLSIDTRVHSDNIAVNSRNDFLPENNVISSQRLKLPEVPLPYYSNDKGETLDYFLKAFESVIDKYSLSTYEKFILLKRQLKGAPLTLINSLGISEQSFEHARDLLEKAFSSETTKKFDAVRRLANLKFSSSDLYEYVGEIRLVQNLFDSLNIDRDFILQYFIWNSIDTNLQSQLVTITNSNKPTLKEINDNIFKAIDRYTEVNEKSRKVLGKTSHDNVSGLAANIDFKLGNNFVVCVVLLTIKTLLILLKTVQSTKIQN